MDKRQVAAGAFRQRATELQPITITRRGVGVAELRAALVLALACCPAAGYSSERRCQELRSDCVCSEPLDNSDTYTTNVYRPSDSEGSRCGYWAANQPAHGTSSFPVRFPAGATATRVLYMPRDGGSFRELYLDSRSNLTNKTICVRSYRNYGADHAPPGNLKIARIGHAGQVSVAWQSGWEPGWTPESGPNCRPNVSWVAKFNDSGGIVGCNVPFNGNPADHVRFPDCQSHWCRFEICHDHNGATGQMALRAEWVQVGGRKRMRSYTGPGSYGSCQVAGAASAPFVGEVAVIEAVTTSPPSSAGGSIYLSHGMVSITDYDPSFWIGPAYEIEGGMPPPKLNPPARPEVRR